MIKIIALGSDPEFFLLDREGNPLSSEGLIGGTKDVPRKLSEEGHFAQEDNVMVEVNIPPCRDYLRFTTEINKCLQLTSEIIPEGASIHIVPSLEFPEAVLQTEQACLIGCSPDYDVHARMENPIIELKSNYRFAGGHIHVSYENPNIDDTEKIIKCMDLFLGVPSVIMDKDTVRKEIYGTPGRFRFTDYGLEYRTLSNFWLTSDELIKWAFESTIKAIDAANNFEKYEKFINNAVEIIRSNDDKKAFDFCKEVDAQVILPTAKVEVYG